MMEDRQTQIKSEEEQRGHKRMNKIQTRENSTPLKGHMLKYDKENTKPDTSHREGRKGAK